LIHFPQFGLILGSSPRCNHMSLLGTSSSNFLNCCQELPHFLNRR
jgi:hypothetical protein